MPCVSWAFTFGLGMFGMPPRCARGAGNRYILSWDFVHSYVDAECDSWRLSSAKHTVEVSWKQQLAFPSTPVVACSLLSPPIRLSPPVLSFIRTCSRQTMYPIHRNFFVLRPYFVHSMDGTTSCQNLIFSLSLGLSLFCTRVVCPYCSVAVVCMIARLDGRSANERW